jgi:ubiquinone/menaquinone biosynthesis C-methylase UbiE
VGKFTTNNNYQPIIMKKLLFVVSIVLLAIYLKDIHVSNFQYIIKLYNSNKLTSIYNKDIHFGMEKCFRQHYNKDFFEKIPINGTILEIGGGPCLFSINTLLIRKDLNVICSDYSNEMLFYAKENYEEFLSKHQKEGPFKIKFEQADAMDLSKYRNIDGVYSNGAIKHFPNGTRGIEESIKTLKKGGILYITELVREFSEEQYNKFYKCLEERTSPYFIVGFFKIGRYFLFPNIKSFENWISSVDFKGITIRNFYDYPFQLIFYIKSM